MGQEHVGRFVITMNQCPIAAKVGPSSFSTSFSTSFTIRRASEQMVYGSNFGLKSCAEAFYARAADIRRFLL